MNKKTLIIVLASIAVLLLAYFFTTGNTDKEVNWSENYHPDKPEPYGLMVIKELLKEYHKDKEFEVLDQQLSKSLPVKKIFTPSNYIFIGNDFILPQADIDTLLEFVSNGNNAFISSHSVPDELMDVLYHSECGEWGGYSDFSDSVIRLNFYNAFYDSLGYKFDFRNNTKHETYNWRYINGTYFCDSASVFEYLAFQDSFYVNFMKVPYGKGSFLIHTSPMAFTNYALLRESSLDYAGKIFSYLNDGAIYWDDYNNMEVAYHGDDNKPSQSPLKFILSQPPLRWAWYLMLALVLIYTLFNIKRKQRVIPVLDPNTNTSLEFVKTIGRLYHQQNDPKKISLQKMKLFLFFIRNRYYLPTNVADEALMQKICDKSEIPLELIKKIFNKFKLLNIPDFDFTEDQLVEFHQSIDYFYKNCK